MNGVLIAAVLVAAGILLAFFIAQYTPLGRRWRVARDRRGHEVVLNCPVHGVQADDTVAHLPSGERVCPHCYSERS